MTPPTGFPPSSSPTSKPAPGRVDPKAAARAKAEEAARAKAEADKERAAREKEAREHPPTKAAFLLRTGQAFGRQKNDRMELDYYYQTVSLPGVPPGDPSVATAAELIAELGKSFNVTRVVDGDTIKVEPIEGGKEFTVRLIGIDTPETVHPQKPVEYFGKEASDFLRDQVEGKVVFLASDPRGDKADRYGRALAYVYLPPRMEFINLKIVADGYGFAYTQFPFRYLDEFRAAERAAREAGRGLWAAEAGAVLADEDPDGGPGFP